MSDRLGSADLIVALSATDDWMQVSSVDELRDHGRVHREGRGSHVGHGLELDFYDESGRLLRPLLAMDLEVQGFVVCTPAQPEAMESRIRTVLGRVRERAADHPQYGAAGRLEHVPAPGDLSALLEWVRTATTEDARGHQSGWLHNLLHAIVG
ncbi:MAG: hypothetical protein GX596_01375 [Propionibacterium sp.]|nr:hypothetical protein [Propionibacterium sp.]